MIGVEISLGTRKCSGCKGKITKGEICLYAQSGWGAQKSCSNLCLKCFIKQYNRLKGVAVGSAEKGEVAVVYEKDRQIKDEAKTSG